MIVEQQEKEARELVVRMNIDRLTGTYADYIENEKGFGGLPEFIKIHLYSPPDKEARDAALISLHERVQSVVGPTLAENIGQLIRLNKLTDELDFATGRELLNDSLAGAENILEAEVSTEQFEAAYRRAGLREKRIRQVFMLADVMLFFFNLNKLPLAKLVIAPLKVAASLLGAANLTASIDAAYSLFQQIRQIEPFIRSFKERETVYIETLLGNTSEREN